MPMKVRIQKRVATSRRRTLPSTIERRRVRLASLRDGSPRSRERDCDGRPAGLGDIGYPGGRLFPSAHLRQASAPRLHKTALPRACTLGSHASNRAEKPAGAQVFFLPPPRFFTMKLTLG